MKTHAGFHVRRNKIKRQLILKNESICSICQRHFPFDDLTIDHIRKRCDGGTSNLHNLQLLCRPCHDIKDNTRKPIKIIKCS